MQAAAAGQTATLGSKLVLAAKSSLTTNILFFALIVLIIIIFSVMMANNQNKDNADEIKKNLGIIGGVTATAILILGFLTYMYLSENIGYMTPFTIIMVFVNLFMSFLAVTFSTLNLTNS
jgi:heme/copper-type cytochrome/quinol oxidase subunit 2